VEVEAEEAAVEAEEVVTPEEVAVEEVVVANHPPLVIASTLTFN
jgi:hypothetical protein